ncbi:enoyl-CoA hydratase [Thraustotheca clavata]|uniref:Enoyl-CoA hydratase domain-containing protein 3, mitochondrial n=1 Tax=Thraustotheca clavata TaxID=74557 RepID=A0A1W0A3R8_9STRA|nr:enoyl-CoA hydratase [Thraustotheca clavata]
MLTTRILDGICHLTLTSAKSRNALSLELIRGLTKTLNEIHDDQSIRVVVLGAEGPAFCSGHNLKEMNAAREACEVNGHASKEAQELKQTFEECSKMMEKIINLNQPVIAKVNGVATAAGCQLVATCDLAYASPKSLFCTPGVNIGLFCTTPGVALGRAVGRKNAMHMLLTGDMVHAPEAADMGLINEVVEEDELDAHVNDAASLIASKSPTAIRIGKQAFYRQMDHNVHDAYNYGSTVMWQNIMAEDARHGIQAFLSKQPPKWQS